MCSIFGLTGSRFPRDQEAETAVRTVKAFLQKETCIQRVIFCVPKNGDLAVWQKLLA